MIQQSTNNANLHTQMIILYASCSHLKWVETTNAFIMT